MKSKPSLRIIFILSTTLCILQISGCAILSPHVHSSELFERKYASSKSGDINANATIYLGELANPDFAVANNDASAQRNKYLDAAGAYSSLRNTAPLVAGAAGVSALFLGTLEGAGVKTLTALGLGVASVLGITKYYDNQPREDLYYQAAIAVDCIINAHSPLGFSKTQHDQLNTNLNILITAVGDANALLEKYETGHSAWNGDPGYSQADVIKKINQGDNTLGNGADFMAVINTAGEVLRGNVRMLVVNVDREILKTEPDPATMLQILNGLGSNTIKIESGANVQAKKKDELKKQSGPTEAQKDVQVKVDKLNSAIVAVDRQLSKTAAAIRTKEELQSCKPPTAKGSLVVIPEDSIITMTAGESRQFTVLGGVGVPRVGLSGDFPSNSVSQAINVVDGTVQIKVTTTAEAQGNATLSIFDGSGLSTHSTKLNIIPVDNKKIASSSSQQTVPPTKPVPPTNSNSVISNDQITAKNKIILVQQALKVKKSGIIDDQTKEKLRKMATFYGLRTYDKLTKEVYDKIIEDLKSKAIKNLNANGEIEKDAIKGSDEIKSARQKLKLNITQDNKNSIDVKLREAIWEFQSENGLSITGILDQETYAKLTSL